jgi:hypothetical protein
VIRERTLDERRLDIGPKPFGRQARIQPLDGAAGGVVLGYGVLGGTGLGLGYISPVSTLLKWFPDRPGMAIMGFGGGGPLSPRRSRCG